MIRINLLGLPKPKRGKRAAAVAVAGEGPSPVLVGVIVAAITVGANGFYYLKLVRERDKIAADMAKAEAENRRLATVKAKYEQQLKDAEIYTRRVKVIDKLRAEQLGPVELLSMIGDTVNGTDAVWLNSMKETATGVDIEGMALSTHAVANLMANLKRTGYFKSVEIKETFQDDSVKDMTAFSFTLSCERQQKT